MAAGAAMLESYRLVVASAEAMLAQARDGRWEEVSRTAGTIGRLTKAIDAARRDAGELSPADEAERVRLLSRLVRIDAEVRQLRQPWARRLDALLGAGTPRRPGDRNPVSEAAGSGKP